MNERLKLPKRRSTRWNCSRRVADVLLALACEREDVVLERHADVFLPHVGQLRLDHDLVRVGFVDVHRRNPGLIERLGFEIGKHLLQSIDFHPCQGADGIPTNKSHGRTS